MLQNKIYLCDISPTKILSIPKSCNLVIIEIITRRSFNTNFLKFIVLHFILFAYQYLLVLSNFLHNDSK